jgi:F-type H+-transporting ATPase subunit c
MSRTLKALVALPALVVALLASAPAFAQPAGEAGAREPWALALGAAIAIGLAVFGGALGQGRAAASALDGIARNPQASGKIFTPMIIGLALVESLVLLAFLIANGLSGKI